MIEIKCTQKEKDKLSECLRGNEKCYFYGKNICETEYTCKECIEHNIKWDIQQESLKPCPFCGGKADIIQHGDIGYYVGCRECKATTQAAKTADYATDLWNRRAGQ